MISKKYLAIILSILFLVVVAIFAGSQFFGDNDSKGVPYSVGPTTPPYVTPPTTPPPSNL